MPDILIEIYLRIALFVFIFLGFISVWFPINKKQIVPDDGFVLALTISVLWPIVLICLFFAWLFDIINNFFRER